MSGYLQRLEYLRAYFNGEKPVNTIMTAPNFVELLDSIIKDIPKPKCACEEFSYRTYTAKIIKKENGIIIKDCLVYAGHYHCGAFKAININCAYGIIYTWEGGNIIKIEDVFEGKII